MKIEDLNLDVRTYNAVRRAGCTTVEELRQRMADDPDDLRRNTGSSTFDRIEEMLAGMQEPQAAVIVSEDYTRAVTLTRSIIANAQAAQQSLYEVCKGLKEMRDGKLYKELGYQSFAEYCESETGIKISQAKKYVAIADRLTDETATRVAEIGVQKLYMLAMLDEPTREAVTEAVDVESVTVKELKAQITALTAERDENEHAAELLSEELDSAKESLVSKDKQFKEALDAKERQLKAVKETGEKNLSECRDHLNGRILELEKRIHEMELAPIDHEMTDADSTEEIAKLKQELENEKLRVMQLQKTADTKVQKAVDEARHKLTQVHEQELQTLREGYEKQLAEKSQEPDETELDEARFNSFRLVFEEIVDELENLLGTMHDEPRIEYVNQLDNYWTNNLLYLKRKGEGAGS